MSSAPASFDYKLLGLHVQSELQLPELLAEAPAADPDVRITVGEVAQVEGANGGGTLSIDGVARFAISAGSHIVVDPTAEAAPRNVRLYLLGSSMGMLLHQRGILPLHATAVEIAGEAFAFMGESGAGKSTLAAWFHDRGHRVIADDVCALRFDSAGQAVVSPGLSRLRLWKEALEASGRDSASYERSYAGADDWDKLDVPTASGLSGDAVVPLRAVYLLLAAEDFAITPLRGVEASAALHAHTYRGHYLTRPQDVRLHWEMCLKLVGQGNLFALARRRGFARFDDQAMRIRAHAERLAGTAGASG